MYLCRKPDALVQDTHARNPSARTEVIFDVCGRLSSLFSLPLSFCRSLERPSFIFSVHLVVVRCTVRTIPLDIWARVVETGLQIKVCSDFGNAMVSIVVCKMLL